MATKKQSITPNPTQIKQQQHDLYAARVKNSMRSLENISSIRATKKMIAQQKTALTAK